MCENPVFRAPLVCVTLGAVCCLAGLVFAIVLATHDELGFDKSRKTLIIPAMLAVGGLVLLVGSCVCCSLQQSRARNWQDCRRKQRAHRVSIGTFDDPDSQEQPIISGYDPRKMSYNI